MKPRLSHAAVAAFALLAVATMALPATASAAPAGTTTVIDCAGKGVARPTSITLTCADGGVSVNKITWSSWHPDQAEGKGVLSWNTCLWLIRLKVSEFYDCSRFKNVQNLIFNI